MCRRSQRIPRDATEAQRAPITVFNTPTVGEHLEGRQGDVKGGVDGGVEGWTNDNQDPYTCQPVSDLTSTRLCTQHERDSIQASQRISCFFFVF